MKKYSFVLIAALSAIVLVSCGDNKKKGQEKEAAADTSSANLTGKMKYNLEWLRSWSCRNNIQIGNLGIEESRARDMVANFNTLYGRNSNNDSIEALIRDYRIDSCTIFSITDYLKKNKKCDGVRIYFGASTINNGSYTDPLYKNKTTIFFYPTIATTESSTSGHDDITKITIPVANCTSDQGYQRTGYIMDYSSNASSQIASFEKVYYNHAPKDEGYFTLSKAVWIDGCVFFCMEDLIRNTSGDVDGLNIKMAAYLGTETQKQLPRETKLGSRQSTVVLVPTSHFEDNINNHWDNWAVQRAISEVVKSRMLVLNHGELCPQVCN